MTHELEVIERKSSQPTDRPPLLFVHGSAHGAARFEAFAAQAARRLAVLDSAAGLHDLAVLRSNRLELLRGDRANQYSIRINARWRICCRWSQAGPRDVEIVDYH